MIRRLPPENRPELSAIGDHKISDGHVFHTKTLEYSPVSLHKVTLIGRRTLHIKEEGVN